MPPISKQIRVLHVLGELRPSGAEMMLAVAGQSFRRNHVVSEIVSTGKSVGSFAESLRSAGYEIRHVPFRKSPRFFVRLFRLCRGGYDAVHIHTERASFWVAITALCAGVPVIVRTIHNSFRFSGWLRIRRKVQRHILRRLGVQHVAVGRSVQETEKVRHDLDTHIVNNWFDGNRFRRRTPDRVRAARTALRVSDEEFVIVTIGNCGPAKNHGALIEALALLPADTRPLYLHAGIEAASNPEHRLAHDRGVAGRIKFLGAVDDVPRLLDAADVYVMPSLNEGFSIAAIEALAVGLPAVVADVPGLKDLREHFSGVRFCAPDSGSVCEALKWVMSLGKEQRAALSHQYPDAAAQYYGVERGVASYAALYVRHGECATRLEREP